MWITAVAIDGEPVPLDGVLASGNIRHGRADALDPATASTAQLSLIGVTTLESAAFRVGVSLAIEADGEPRFTGTITDAAVDEDTLTLIAAGTLSTLGRYVIGASDWPSEAWSARVERVFAEAGLSGALSLLADGSFNPVLTARVADPEQPLTLLDYLDQLAEDVGAAVTDLPDGRVLVQQLSARQMASGIVWSLVPDGIAWNEADPGCSWDEAETVSDIAPDWPDVLAPIYIDPSEVVYVPVWEQSLAIENEVTVGYGADEEVTIAEPTSNERYGPFPGSIDTEILSLADATERATQRVSRRSFPRWVIHSAALTDGRALQIGQVVELDGFPDGSPHEAWRGVLEGWVDTFDGGDPDGVWTCELALSDPMFSGLALNWGDVPAPLSWDEVSDSCRWIDATSLDALSPSFPALMEV